LLTFFEFKLRFREKLNNCIINCHFFTHQTNKQTFPHILVPLSTQTDNFTSTSNAITTITKLTSQDCNIAGSSLNKESTNNAQILPVDSPGRTQSTVSIPSLPTKRLNSSLSPPMFPADITRTKRFNPSLADVTATIAVGRENRTCSVPDVSDPAIFGATVTSFGGLDTQANSDTTSLSGEDTPQWFKAFQAQFHRHEERLAQLESLVAENSRLKKELAAAYARIQALERNNGVPSSQAETTNITVEDHQYGNSPFSFGPTGSNASKYATVARKAAEQDPTPAEAYPTNKKGIAQSKKDAAQKQPKKPKISPAKLKKAATKFFVAPTIRDQGESTKAVYEFIYLPNKYRDRLSVVRRKLRHLGVDNGRILDIHYPARGTVALLLHSGYREEFEAVLKKHNLSPIENFDPTAATNVSDPVYSGLSDEARQLKAKELHQARLLRGLQHIREHVRRQVAYDYVAQGWLSRTQVMPFLGSTSASDKVETTDTDDMDVTPTGAGEPGTQL
jgi:hypothetical protein